MNELEAKAKIERAIEDICVGIARKDLYEPRWEWLDQRRARIYDNKGQPLMTFNIEALQ